MPPMWERLGELDLPVTLVVGETDAKFRAIAEQMATTLGDARLLVVPEAGHAVHLDQPSRVARILAALWGP